MTNTENTTVLICSECGVGNYWQGFGPDYGCSECGHMVTQADILPTLDAGETLTDVDGSLAVLHGEEQ